MMADKPATVRMKHIRQANLCAGGARDWFKHYGFDWNDFLLNGKSADDLDATGDVFAQEVTAIARKDADDGR